MRPLTLRPPERCFPLVSDFSGVERVISSKSRLVWKRLPGEVGL
jgi:hypothetical protein